MIKIDVIIPLKSCNENVVDNIFNISLFREVNKIHIGDNGIPKNIFLKLKKNKKVILHNHKNIYSLGASIKNLISLVTTEVFAYFHADVILPKDWFSVMLKSLKFNHFAECRRINHYNVFIEDASRKLQSNFRPLSGAQMGYKDFVLKALHSVDDDHLFRVEDIIIADLVQKNGGRYYINNNTYHIHQVGFNKFNEHISNNYSLSLTNDYAKKDERIFVHQLLGIYKYLNIDNSHARWSADYSIAVLKEFQFPLNQIAPKTFNWKFFILLRPLRMFLKRLRVIYKVIFSSEKKFLEINL